jgi:hypothetical protein
MRFRVAAVLVASGLAVAALNWVSIRGSAPVVSSGALNSENEESPIPSSAAAAPANRGREASLPGIDSSPPKVPKILLSRPRIDRAYATQAPPAHPANVEHSAYDFLQARESREVGANISPEIRGELEARLKQVRIVRPAPGERTVAFETLKANCPILDQRLLGVSALLRVSTEGRVLSGTWQITRPDRENEPFPIDELEECAFDPLLVEGQAVPFTVDYSPRRRL